MSTPSVIPAPVLVDLDILSGSIANAIDECVSSYLDVDDIFEEISEAVTFEVRECLIESRDTETYGEQQIGDPIVKLSPETSPADIIGDAIRSLECDDIAMGYTVPCMTSNLRDIYDDYPDEVAEWSTDNLDVRETVVMHGIDGLIDNATMGWIESVAYSVATEIIDEVADDISGHVAGDITVSED